MTVYVITKGEYGDYHICAVTLDEKRAELLRRYYSTRSEEAYVESFETNELCDEPSMDVLLKLKPVFSIIIHRDGTVLGETAREPVSYENEPYENEFYFSKDDTFVAYVVADDYGHARKIAFDMRAKMLAERFGL